MSPKDVERSEPLDLEALLVAARDGQLVSFLADTHSADLAEELQELDGDDKWSVFLALDPELRAELLEYSSDPQREELLARLEGTELADVIERLPADEAVDLLALTEGDKREEALRLVEFERAGELRKLATYPADSAGGVMTTDFVTAQSDAHVGDVIKHIRTAKGPASDEEGGTFVVDAEGHPVGFISDRDLVTTQIHTVVSDCMETDVHPVRVDADQEEVGQLFHKYGLLAVPVVDASGALVGVVSAEDAYEVIEDEAEEDFRRIVGTSNEEQTRLPILARVRGRLPLQGLTVLGGLVTAQVLSLAGGDSDTVGPSLLRYIPIIIGLAGNVGIQASTILVRAFATGEVTPERETSVLGSEVVVGLMIGVICGAVTTLVAGYMEGTGGSFEGQFGFALGFAIAISVTWASFLGCAVPMVCRRLGIDPAVVAGPFLITLSDISGSSIFVLVAHLLMGPGPSSG